jgi:flagellar biosynthesis/type III secretory pathway M-ring protein FliF/YscJ
MAHNTLMYKRIDPQLREQQRRAWNTPILWPVVVVLLILMISIVPAVMTYRRKEQSAARQGVSQ